ncbi:MAG: DUF4091 domain-containing protein [Verrucomicrobia bacterium]|nr:DUF4091 domain-containing protein [Verrucomicrobiota bacterium]
MKSKFFVFLAACGILLEASCAQGQTPRPLVRIPHKWSPSGKAEQKTEAGRSIFGVEENGIWHSEPLEFQEGGVYEMRCEVRCLSKKKDSRMQAFAGPEMAPQLSEELVKSTNPGDWKEFSLRFSMPKGANLKQRIRLSSYGAPDLLEFSKVEVFQLFVAHSSVDGVALGAGERLSGALYEYAAPLADLDAGIPWRNISRALVEQSAKLHDRRWSFSSGQAVVHHHQVGSHRFEEASVQINLLTAWTTPMTLAVEASSNGLNYLPCGVLADTVDRETNKEGQSRHSLELPKELLPCRELWVRVRAEAPDASAKPMQIAGYQLTAKLESDSTASRVGSTAAVSVQGTDEDLLVTPLVNTGRDNNFSVRVENRASGAQTVEPTLSVATNGAKPELFTLPAFELAAGASREVSLPWMFRQSGEQKLTFTAGQQRHTKLVARTVTSQLDRDDFGKRLPAADANVDLWWASSGWKISQARNAPTGQDSAVRVSLAQRETECAQVVLRPKAPLKNLRIVTESLRTKEGTVLEPSALEVLRVEYVSIQKPSDEYGAAGMWPDPITPISGPLNLSSGANHPLWIRVSSNAETKPGNYRGKILLKADGWQAEVPLDVTVFGFALPETPTFRALFGDRPSTVSKYHRATTDETKKKTTERYIDALGKHRINPYSIATVPLIATWPAISENWGKDAQLVNDPAQSHGGSKCLLISDENPAATIQAGVKQRFPLPDDGKFNVRLWYRTGSNEQSAVMYMSFTQADGKHLGGQNKAVKLPASEHWREFKYEFSNIPKEASKAGLFFGAAPYAANGETLGKLWIDDLSVTHGGSGTELLADGDMEAYGDIVRARFNWDEWDAAMERSMKLNHFNTFILNVPGLGGGDYHSRREGFLLGHAMGTPEHEAIFADWCQQVREHLRDKGWLNMAVAYPYDEPHPKDVPFIVSQLGLIKKYFPELKCMIPTNGEAKQELVGLQDYWCTMTSGHKQAFADARIAAGDTYTLYTCVGPSAPFASNYIDRPATDMRALMWQAWLTKATGFLMWQSVYWTSEAAYPGSLQNPYADAMSWQGLRPGLLKGDRRPFKAGDGRFLYPPKACFNGTDSFVDEPPADSIRLEMTRDGVEDWEYFSLLRARIADAHLSEEQAAPYKALLNVPPEVSASLRKYTFEPEPIESHREALARAIETLGKRK